MRIEDEGPPPDAPPRRRANGHAVAKTFPLVMVRDIPEIFEQAWLIEGVVPRFESDGTAGYLFGPEKSRKSLFTADVALSVTTGTDALGRFKVAHRGTAVGFYAEDPKQETSRRIHRLARARGIEVPENLFLIDVPALDLGSPEHQSRLLETLRSVADLAFAWFDPMVRLHHINDNRSEELGPIHTFMRTCARACPGAVILLNHHTVKGGDSYRGSTDYGAFGDFNIFAAKPDAYTTRIHTLEFRGGPPGRPFSYGVEDGSSDDGPTMKLVVSALDDDAATDDRTKALEQIVKSLRSANPSMTGRDGLEHVRKLGSKVKDCDFWELWKGARPHA